MSYKDLEIWQIAKEMSIEIHKMSFKELPSFENFEEGSQIRRSVKSVRSNIVEGYGRQKYQQEYYRVLTFSLASCNETIDHLEMLLETESLKNEKLYKHLHDRLELLGRKINTLMQKFDVKQNSFNTEN